MATDENPSRSFLLGATSGIGDDRDFQAALSSAIIVQKVAAPRPQNLRAQFCRFLCELGRQLRRNGAFEYGAALPLARPLIAEAMGISLTHTKRALALLSLSKVIETDGVTLTVTDWKRVCDYARVDPAALQLGFGQDGDEASILVEVSAPQITLRGEPANFV